MMTVIAIEEGGIACDASCPYYEESGAVQCYGGPKKSHCQAIMQDWSFNCNKFNPKRLYKLRLTPAVFQEIVKGHGLKAIKQRKLYPKDHKEIHPVGERPKGGSERF